jgi:hypothetical protein
MLRVMLGPEVATILREELEDLRLRIIANMDAAGQTTTGKTARSMKVEITETGGDTYGILTGRQAFATLERGSRPWSRPPKKVPRFFADIIGEWIKNKGLTGKLNKWAVARTLIYEGSDLYRTGGRDDIYTPEIQKTLDQLGERIIEGYRVLVTDRLNFNTTINIEV